MVTFGLDFEILFAVAIAFLVIGLAIGIGYFFISEDFFKFRSKTERYREQTKDLFKATERKISTFLNSNIGKAYSTKALTGRLNEEITHPYYKQYLKNNGEDILEKMVSEGLIQKTQKNQGTHYFILNK